MIETTSKLRPKQVEAEYGIRAGHLAQLRYTKQGPTYIKLGERTVLYDRADVEAWINSHKISPNEGAA